MSKQDVLNQLNAIDKEIKDRQQKYIDLEKELSTLEKKEKENAHIPFYAKIPKQDMIIFQTTDQILKELNYTHDEIKRLRSLKKTTDFMFSNKYYKSDITSEKEVYALRRLYLERLKSSHNYNGYDVLYMKRVEPSVIHMITMNIIKQNKYNDIGIGFSKLADVETQRLLKKALSLEKNNSL